MVKSVEIEIFVRDCAERRLLEWAGTKLGPLSGPHDDGTLISYDSPRGPVAVIYDIEGGPFLGLWFNTPRTPWERDVDCAREAARDLGCTVRCKPESPPLEGHAERDMFVEISGSSERLVAWQ